MQTDKMENKEITFKKAAKLVEEGVKKIKEAGEIVEPYASDYLLAEDTDVERALTIIKNMYPGNTGIESSANFIIRTNNQLNSKEDK